MREIPLLVCLLTAGLTGAVQWRQAQPGYGWSFPQDHWAHPEYRIEWWYFTGHLRVVGQERPRFGYQFTFYRVGLVRDQPDLDSDWAARSLIVGHAAVSDLESGEHRFSELVYRAFPLLGGFDAAPGPRIAWSRAPAGTDGTWELAFNGRAFDFRSLDQRRQLGLEFSTRPAKPLVFQGPGGFSRKGADPASASYYYSFTRLQTQGRLLWKGVAYPVEGQSWMDHEFSSSVLAENQVGWDWFSLQLDDGREVMLYQLHDRSGAADFGRGTLVPAEGDPLYLALADWTIEPQRSWESPAGTLYPVQWNLRIPGQGLELQVVPLLDDQENRSRLIPGLDYWEGAVEVLDAAGRLAGHGYLEMTGYGKDSRPPI